MAGAVMASTSSHFHLQQQQQQHYRQPRWPAQGPPAAKHAPPTPPMSSTIEARRPVDYPSSSPVPGPSRVALPPIAHLDRTLSSMQPLTPPDDTSENGMHTTTRLPPILPAYTQSPGMMSVDDDDDEDPFAPSSNSGGHQPAMAKRTVYEYDSIPAPLPSAPVELESTSHRTYAPHRHATYSHFEARAEREVPFVYQQQHVAAVPAYNHHHPSSHPYAPAPAPVQPQSQPQPQVPIAQVPSQPTAQVQPQAPPAVCVWDSAPHLIDWLDFTRTRSAHFIAEKTCEMICYLWFAERPVTRRVPPSSNGQSSSRPEDQVEGVNSGEGERGGRDARMSYPSPHHSPASPSRVAGVAESELATLLSVPTSGHMSGSPTSSPSMRSSPPVRDSPIYSSSPSHASPTTRSRSSPTHSSPTRTSPSTLQLVATPSFISFMQKLLETTQVSQSVIVLSLHYIYRLKEKNHFTRAQRGSEFRIAVAGMMMANKFLDDNTYTNKTWSEVSGIALPEINRMEREFLLGVEFNLYVDKPTYESWLNLLKGLVQAKERDSMSSSMSGRAGVRGGREMGAGRRRGERRGQGRYETRQPQVQRPVASAKPQQYQPPASASSHYATPTRLPPLARAVPAAAYYYPHTSSTSTSTSNNANSQQYTAPTGPQTQPRPSTATTSASYARARSISPTPGGYADVRMDEGPLSASTHYPSSLSSLHTSTSSSHPLALNLHANSTHPTMNGNQNHHNTAKRTAEAAFSPTSASFGAHLPSKRPSSMVLTIPDVSFGSSMSAGTSATTTASSAGASAGYDHAERSGYEYGYDQERSVERGVERGVGGGYDHGYENSPLESLSDFSRMSIVGEGGSPEKRMRGEQSSASVHQHQQPSSASSLHHHPHTQSSHQAPPPPSHHQHTHHHQPQQTTSMIVPTTLVAPYSYRVDARSQASKPQELYFYTLASSPMEPPVPTRSRNGRRGRGVSISDAVSSVVGSTHGAGAGVSRPGEQGAGEQEQDQNMEEDDDANSVVEMDREEWERERERDAHGERRRTRKARLMRTQTSVSSTSSAAEGQGVYHQHQPGAYAYDFSRSVNAYRQHYAPSTASNNASGAYDASSGGHYAQHAGTTLQPIQPRQYVPTVVQSASTSPASGVVYVRGSGEVGYAAAVQGYAGGPPSSATAYGASAESGYQQQQQQSAHKTIKLYDYSPSQSASQATAAQQHQQSQATSAQQYAPYTHHAHHHPTFERRLSRTSSHSWYSQNQGGSVSYHPSPVQEKAEYFSVAVAGPLPPVHAGVEHRVREYEYDQSQPQQSQSQPQQQHSAQAYANGAGVALPHFHDNVWAKPPAVVLAREDEDERGRQMVSVPASASASTHRLQADVVSVSRSCSSGTGRSASTHTSTSTGTSGSGMTGTSGTGDDGERRSEYGGEGYDAYSDEGDVGGERGEIPSAPFANAGPAGVYVPFGSEYARYQGYHQQQQPVQYSTYQQYATGVSQHQQYHPQQQGQQRDVYSASGVYPSGGSVFVSGYNGYQPVKGGQARY